jgi:hypothetical protein
MTVLKRLPMFLFAATVAACATTAQFVRHMEQFPGRPIAEAQQAFGYSYAVKDLEDGTRAYTWTNVRTGVVPGYESPTVVETFRTGDHSRITTVTPGTYFPPYVYRDACEFTFITDGAGTILRWSARGDGCRGQPGGVVLQSGR